MALKADQARARGSVVHSSLGNCMSHLRGYPPDSTVGQDEYEAGQDEGEKEKHGQGALTPGGVVHELLQHGVEHGDEEHRHQNHKHSAE